MGQGFAEHRRLLVENVERLRTDITEDVDRRLEALRSEMQSGFAAVEARFVVLERRFDTVDASVAEAGTRLDRVETKLDAFIDMQTAVNRTILERLSR